MSESLGFHAHDGWYFKRGEDGSVRILAPDSLGPGGSQRIDLDANTWASIVASVSAASENGETHRAALAFHDGTVFAPSDAHVPAGAAATYPTCPTCCTHDHSKP